MLPGFKGGKPTVNIASNYCGSHIRRSSPNHSEVLRHQLVKA